MLNFTLPRLSSHFPKGLWITVPLPLRNPFPTLPSQSLSWISCVKLGYHDSSGTLAGRMFRIFHLHFLCAVSLSRLVFHLDFLFFCCHYQWCLLIDLGIGNSFGYESRLLLRCCLDWFQWRWLQRSLGRLAQHCFRPLSPVWLLRYLRKPTKTGRFLSRPCPEWVLAPMCLPAASVRSWNLRSEESILGEAPACLTLVCLNSRSESNLRKVLSCPSVFSAPRIVQRSNASLGFQRTDLTPRSWLPPLCSVWAGFNRFRPELLQFI